jgi:hypothetical protein
MRTILTALAILTAAPALAQSGRMTLTEGDADCLARVEIENRAGWYIATETIPTPYGDVLIHYETIGHHGPGADDRITVLELPEGVYANPMEAGIPDGETLSLCLYEWRGG